MLVTTDSVKIGDIVRLKTGSPSMTVNDIRPNGMCVCVWFQENYPAQHEFNFMALDVITSGDTGTKSSGTSNNDTLTGTNYVPGVAATANEVTINAANVTIRPSDTPK